jgi:hypothetical protein
MWDNNGWAGIDASRRRAGNGPLTKLWKSAIHWLFCLAHVSLLPPGLAQNLFFWPQIPNLVSPSRSKRAAINYHLTLIIHFAMAVTTEGDNSWRHLLPVRASF